MIDIEREKQFGITLNKMRISRGITLRGLAKLLNYSPAYISDIEKGNRLPTLELMERINVLCPTEIELNKLNKGYILARPTSLTDIITYICNNDLIDTIRELKQIDKDGTKIKKMVLDMKQEDN